MINLWSKSLRYHSQLDAFVAYIFRKNKWVGETGSLLSIYGQQMRQTCGRCIFG